MRRLADAYLNDSVLTMTPEQVLIRLYDGLLVRIAESEQELRQGTPAKLGASIGAALDIVAALRESLDRSSDAEAIPRLDQLYETLSHWLLMANLKRSAEPLHNCRRVIQVLQEGWKNAIEVAHAH